VPLDLAPNEKEKHNIEGLAKNINQHPHLLHLNSNSYESNFDKFQNANTFKMSDNNFFNALNANQRPNLEYISNLTDSLTMSKKDLTHNSHTIQIKSVDGKDESSKENLPEFMVYMQKNNGNPVSLTQQFSKITEAGPIKPGVSSLNELNNQEKYRIILGEQRNNTNVASTNGKGLLDPLDNNPEGLRKQFRHEYRIDTQNTNYDMSDDESIHEIDSRGMRFRKKPNLMIKLEERRTTQGSNLA